MTPIRMGITKDKARLEVQASEATRLALSRIQDACAITLGRPVTTSLVTNVAIQKLRSDIENQDMSEGELRKLVCSTAVKVYHRIGDRHAV